MVLPVNIDSTYADSGSDASVALHQQHHDEIHAAVNKFPQTLRLVATGLNKASGQHLVAGAIAGGALGTLVMTVDRLCAVPIVFPESTPVDRISMNVDSGAAGTARLSIYSPGANNLPDALLVDGGTVSTGAGLKEATISQTLSGLYWLVVSASATATLTATGAGACAIIGQTSISATPATWCYSGTAAPPASAHPATFGTPTLAGTSAPRLAVRLA